MSVGETVGKVTMFIVEVSTCLAVVVVLATSVVERHTHIHVLHGSARTTIVIQTICNSVFHVLCIVILLKQYLYLP